MKRPAFQFYPADWRNNAKLRRCTEGARGVWIDLLCLLHDADEYGVLRWPLKDVARALGAPLKLLKELAEKGVLKGGDRWAGQYVFTPRHAGKNGEPVTLVAGKGTPCWFCSRFVADEHIRHKRGEGTRFGAGDDPPKGAIGDGLGDGFGAVIGDELGDGPTSTSSTSLKTPKGVREPTEAHRTLATELSVDCDGEFLKFEDYCAANGRVYADEVRAFSWWLRNAVKYQRQPSQPRGVPSGRDAARRATIEGLTGGTGVGAGIRVVNEND